MPVIQFKANNKTYFSDVTYYDRIKPYSYETDSALYPNLSVSAGILKQRFYE